MSDAEAILNPPVTISGIEFHKAWADKRRLEVDFVIDGTLYHFVYDGWGPYERGDILTIEDDSGNDHASCIRHAGYSKYFANIDIRIASKAFRIDRTYASGIFIVMDAVYPLPCVVDSDTFDGKQPYPKNKHDSPGYCEER